MRLKSEIEESIKHKDQVDGTLTDGQYDEEGAESKNKYQEVIKLMWSEFFDKRNGLKPSFVRVFPLSKVITFINEIYDIRWNLEGKLEMDDSQYVLPRFVVILLHLHIFHFIILKNVPTYFK